MNRRTFFTALAALPFVPGAMKKLAAMKPVPIQYFADFSAPIIVGEWRMLDGSEMAKTIDNDILRVKVLLSE